MPGLGVSAGPGLLGRSRKMTHNRTIDDLGKRRPRYHSRSEHPRGYATSHYEAGLCPEGGQVEILPDINPDAPTTSAWLEAMGVQANQKEERIEPVISWFTRNGIAANCLMVGIFLAGFTPPSSKSLWRSRPHRAGTWS